jgi:iron complex transport system ATP-binding protein
VTEGLALERISFGYGGMPVLREVSLSLRRGEAAALVGPNGVGKSTLLSIASGTLRPQTGTVRWGGVDLAAMPRRTRAQRVAQLPQVVQIPFAFSARELVALGRTPYLATFGRASAGDHAAIARNLSDAGVGPLADRSVLELSGGERQRVLLAMTLAQDPELLLLDEPTAQLDLAHQVAALELVQERCARGGVTVLAAVHDLNLASLFFERVLVLHRGQLVADGPPRSVLTADLVREVFSCEVTIVERPAGAVPLVALQRASARATSELI